MTDNESGTALLITMLALSLFTLLGLYMALNATTGVKISDNFESQLQATYAAMAGLNHARALLRGLAFDDVLRGPDGAYDATPASFAQARSFRFRMPLPLPAAHMLDIFDPSADVAAIADDGIVSTGFCDGVNGTALIPKAGISQIAPNPYGPGTILTSRYFVKVTDNNGDASELSGDMNDNPFVDGDGIVILRSLGVAKTLSEKTGLVSRRNSVAVFEARLKRLSTWGLGPALVVQGPSVDAFFSGACEISGGTYPGIGTVDVSSSDPPFLDETVRGASEAGCNITGGGQPNPSVRDITAQIRSNPDQSLLLNPAYLWDFVHRQAPKIADGLFNGAQNWLSANAPYLGFYDYLKPINAPGQDPRITVVDGDLRISGNISGGGLLIVTGDFSYSGAFLFNGLIVAVGSGKLTTEGSGQGIAGGVFVAKLAANAGGEIAFGTPAISIGGDSRISSNREAVRMAISLIPPSQISFREIAGSDP